MKEVTTLELLKDIYIKADLLDLKITHLYDDVDDRDMRTIKDFSVRLLREITNKILIEEQKIKMSKENSAYRKLFEIEKHCKDGTARIMVDSKTIYLGCFNSIDEAKKARDKAEKELFGEFAYKGGDNQNV